jgi:hypothetical protein
MNRVFLDITIAQQDSWQDFANTWTVTDVFGQQRKLAAINWFVALNTRLATIGTTPGLTPPLNPNSIFNPTISISQSGGAGGDIIMGMSVSISADQAVWVQWSGNIPKSRNFLSGSVRQRVIFTQGDGSPQTLIDGADLIADTSVRQFTAFAVDENGRSTPTVRQNVFPE